MILPSLATGTLTGEDSANAAGACSEHGNSTPIVFCKDRLTMAELKAKAEEIYLVLSEPDVDLWKLRELALTEGGLVNGMKRKSQ